MESQTTEGGLTVYVDESEGEIGSEGPFYVVYRSEDGADRYGYFCSNCETLDTAMDTMGRLVCNNCGNTKKPDEWDAAHE